MGGLLPAITQEQLEAQRDVVMNERRQSYENRPYGLASETLLAALYPPATRTAGRSSAAWPTWRRRRSTTCTTSARRTTRRQRVPRRGRRRRRRAHVRDRRTLLRRHPGAGRGRAARCPPRPCARCRPPHRAGGRRERCRGSTWRGTRRRVRAGDAELDVAAAVLAARPRVAALPLPRLRPADRAVRDRVPGQRAARLDVPRHRHGAAGVRALAHLEARSARARGHRRARHRRQHELERARNGIETHFIDALQNVGGFGGRADQLNLYHFHTGTPDYVEQDLARYRALTPADVATRVRLAARARRRAQRRARGRTDLAAETAMTAACADPPAPAAARAGPPARPVQHRLELRPRRLLVERHELPVVDARLVVRPAPPATRPPSPAAPSSPRLLDQGTATSRATRIADEVELLGASLEDARGWDSTVVAARAHAAPRPALDLLADVVLRPTFPGDELERAAGAARRHPAGARRPRHPRGPDLRRPSTGPATRTARPSAAPPSPWPHSTPPTCAAFHEQQLRRTTRSSSSPDVDGRRTPARPRRPVRRLVRGAPPPPAVLTRRRGAADAARHPSSSTGPARPSPSSASATRARRATPPTTSRSSSATPCWAAHSRPA
jgi:zinc protease